MSCDYLHGSVHNQPPPVALYCLAENTCAWLTKKKPLILHGSHAVCSTTKKEPDGQETRRYIRYHQSNKLCNLYTRSAIHACTHIMHAYACRQNTIDRAIGAHCMLHDQTNSTVTLNYALVCINKIMAVHACN